MASANLPSFPVFDVHGEPSSVGSRWTKWRNRFDNFLVALNIDDDKRKKAMLLHYAGPDVYDIFETLPAAQQSEDDEEYNITVASLAAYFCPKVNTEYETYVFRQARQNDSETLDTYHTRLRHLAATCDFKDVDREIKSQIILGCSSSRFRRMALKDYKLTLQELLDTGRALEMSETHARGMETMQSQKENPVHAIQSRKTSRQFKKGKAANEKQNHDSCYNCGGQFPHDGGQMSCPARGKTCRTCGKNNHFEKVCRSRNKETGNHSGSAPQLPAPQRQKTRVYQIETEDGYTQKDESQSDSDDEYVYIVCSLQRPTQPHTQVTIQNTPVDVIIDSGASVNIIDEATYQRLAPGCKLDNARAKICTYGSTTPLPLRGKFTTTINAKKKTATATFYVIKGNAGSLLSYQTATELGLLQIVNSLSTSDRSVNETSIAQLLDDYNSLFQGIGKLKDFQVKLHIDETLQPSVQPHRRIPFHLRKRVEEELDKLEKQGVIEKISGPTPWVSPIVVTPKPKTPDKVRICVDMRLPNQAIQRERHITPTVDDLIHDLNGAVVFSKLDLNSGYHQLELHPDSRYITTFTTHTGLWRYTRLNFGISSAAEVFQNTIQQMLEGIPNVRNISDDILVYGKTQGEHNRSLKAVFERLREKNLTLNKEKCEYSKPKLEFFGYVFSKNGVSADPKKISAIQRLPAPANVTEVRSLLGMVTYCSRFIPDFATTSQPLRELTRKDHVWSWGPKHQSAMDKLEAQLIKHSTMAYFDPVKATTVLVDASPVGLGAILSQRSPTDNKEEHIVAYASRALTGVEQRYSQTEREALAIIWACEHFHLYLYGSHFTVITDHKPLELIFNNPKSNPPARLERWRLRLQPYSFTVKYKAGKDNPADYMSRHPTQGETSQRASRMAEEYISFIVDHTLPKAMTLEMVQEETKKDPTLQEVIRLLETGLWPNKSCESPGKDRVNYNDLRALFRLRGELTVNSEANVLLRGTKLVLPTSLRQKAVDLAHTGHSGIVKTKQLIREKVWFPGIDGMVENTIQHCIPCQAATEEYQMEPLHMSELPKAPWLEVSIDFTGPYPSGDYLLVVLDEYSRYPEVEIVRSTSATTVIPRLDKIFSTFGVPEVVKTDNGPPFNGQDFTNFSHYLGFRHRKITPCWPRANAEVERFMRTLKKTLTATNSEGKPWKQNLYTFLRNYRATPHSTTQKTPAELLFGRKLRTTLPTLDNVEPDAELHNTDKCAKERMKMYADVRNRARPSKIKTGDVVLVRQHVKGKLMTPYVAKPYTVVKVKGSMVTATRAGRLITRNSSFFKVLPASTPVNLDTASCGADDRDLSPSRTTSGHPEQSPGTRPPNSLCVPGQPGQGVNVGLPYSPPQPQARYPRRTNRKPPQFLIDEV